MSVRVAFCVNDERGCFTGRVDAVDFEDHRGFEANLARWPGTGIAFAQLGPDSIRVGRRRFGIKPGSLRAWEGSWCWDAVSMSQGESKRLLLYLLERDFEVEGCSLEGPFAPLIEAAEESTPCP